MDDSLFGVSLAAEMAKRYREDEHEFLETLAFFLETSLPEITRIERSGPFWAKNKPVSRISITLGSERFVLQSETGALNAKIIKNAQGVAYRTECPSVAQWIEKLTAALYSRIGQSQSAREALSKWLGSP